MKRKWIILLACLGALGLLIGSSAPVLAFGSNCLGEECFIENIDKTAPGTNHDAVSALHLDHRPDTVLEPVNGYDVFGNPRDLCSGSGDVLTHVSFVIRVDKYGEYPTFAGTVDEAMLDCASIPTWDAAFKAVCEARVEMSYPDNDAAFCSGLASLQEQQDCFDRLSLAETGAVPLCAIKDKDLIERAFMNFLDTDVGPQLGGQVAVVQVSKSSVLESDVPPFFVIFNFKLAVK